LFCLLGDSAAIIEYQPLVVGHKESRHKTKDKRDESTPNDPIQKIINTILHFISPK
jgi:hypothetical protein